MTHGTLRVALDRTTAFDRKGTSKQLLISQAGEFDDDFDAVWKTGTQEIWSVPCLVCNEYQKPVWREQRADASYYGLLWDTNDTTLNKDTAIHNLPELLKTVRYVCKFCNHQHTDCEATQKIWNDKGKYVQTNPQATIEHRSFHWNALVKDKWSDLVSYFCRAKEKDAKGDSVDYVTFHQKKMATPKNSFMRDREDYFLKTFDGVVDNKWDEEVIRIATIDVQKFCFWLEVRAWSKEGKSRQLYYGKISIESDLLNQLKLLNVDPRWTFVDVGNTESGDVYSFVDRNKFTGLRGDNWSDDTGYIWRVRGKEVRYYFSFPHSIPNAKNGTHYFNFSPTPCRDIACKLRDGQSHEFLSLDNPDYRKQVYAEKKVPILDKYGRKTFKYKRIHPENHGFDCLVMNVVGCLINGKVGLI